jgi:hypothetical protein
LKEVSLMWRSFLDSLAEGLAMTDPSAYSYYLALKWQDQLDAEVEPDPSPRPGFALRTPERPSGRGEEVPA